MNNQIKNVLILGAGAREHALASSIASALVRRGANPSELARHIFLYPGNGGTAVYHNISDEEISLNKLDTSDNTSDNSNNKNKNKILHDALLNFVKKKNITLIVVGPEDFLAAGVTDYFSAHGIRVFGPTQAAAQMETSKSFAKDVMHIAGVPTARYREFKDSEYREAENFIQTEWVDIPSDKSDKQSDQPKQHWVLKSDGLCAGKGVAVPTSKSEALGELDKYFSEKSFGKAGENIIIEEYMEGEEASVLAFVDGESVRFLPVSQDHKRAFDDDQGPNTGGMGVYTPVPIFKSSFYKKVENKIILPVLDELKRRGIVYQGILYAGLMIKGDSIRVVEFNARFGDPECQCVLPLFLKTAKSDFLTIIEACIDGKLGELPAEDFRIQNIPACTVVMASGGYPGKYKTGKVIKGLSGLKEEGEMKENQSVNLNEFKLGASTAVYHAGTTIKKSRDDKGEIITNGGRVLSVCAYGKEGDSLATVIENCYSQVKKISFEDGFYRNDIGKKGLRI